MSATPTFRNRSGLDFTDISSEKWRDYTFSDGTTIRVDEPLCLNVTDAGHRIFDSAGISHFIPFKWTHLRWEAKEGQPHFVL